MTTTEDIQNMGADFSQRVIGLAEATNQLMKKASARDNAIRAEAENAYGILKAAGKIPRGQTKDQVVEGFVAHPEAALKLAVAAIKEAEDDSEDSEKKDEKKEKDEYEESMLGGADKDEDSKEKEASRKRLKSDDVWEKGFGF